ncbi:Por secretion system C-terminal sorting domain-containing protein [Catalinimonas alkaloidigena]|uniref:Por secretion system C-terminal sorting domain-containing protein n=1 Tax=Catalinimonas alkaloidigena TaxID=1075417 RepID=A0A1G9S7U2_9BACT|nr:T9SS type A sorting domain-containing protein [Catalinimonas alkaloidigena]SDM31548.1 Por secretion system C-terminal sorting domain-containing protein [Catalinimonas alkaloidigena]
MQGFIHLLLGLLWLILPGFATAQFVGSQGDGAAVALRVGVQLDGTVYPAIVLYQGGEGDGFSAQQRAAVLSGEALVAFRGGRGDGFTAMQQPVLVNGETLVTLFTGGNGDGFAHHLSPLLLDGTQLATLFSGGGGDGFSVFSDHALLTGEAFLVYVGGDGDGFSKEYSDALVLTGEALAMFRGQGGDGFTATLASELYLDVLPLPVEIIHFEALQQERAVLLVWNTASEQNNERFEVERSADGFAFAKIDEVAGSGTTTAPQQYRVVDPQPLTGWNYYRLRQLDYDGSASFTDIRSVRLDPAHDAFAVTIYPNPNRDRRLQIRLEGTEASTDALLHIYNAAGVLLDTRDIHANESLQLPWQWAAGTYFLQITTDEKQITKTLIIVD